MAHHASGAAGRSDARVLTADQLAALASGQSADVSGVTAEAASPAVPVTTTASSGGPSGQEAAATRVAAAAPVPAAASTTTTTEAPTTTTTEPRPTTTTTRPPPTTTTTAPAPTYSHSETGSASWYNAPAGTCANPSLPFGTVVSVTNLANGATTHCTVEDRGPYAGGRIIDLSESTFAQIASPSDGVIQVRIQW